MRTLTRIAAAVSVCAALFGVSSVLAGRGRPAPPPDVLCGCYCPDGSIVIVHAPDENSCPIVCQSACLQDM